MWLSLCGHTLDALRALPIYPELVRGRNKGSGRAGGNDGRHTLKPNPTAQPMYLANIPALSLRIRFLPKYGMRIYGSLAPPETAVYYFALSANGAASLTLSADASMRDVHTAVSLNGRVAYDPNSAPVAAQISPKGFKLHRGRRYPFELVYVRGSDTPHIKAMWRTSAEAPFAVIKGAALVPGSAAPDTRAYYRQRVERFASGKLATLSPYPFPVAASEKISYYPWQRLNGSSIDTCREDLYQPPRPREFRRNVINEQPCGILERWPPEAQRSILNPVRTAYPTENQPQALLKEAFALKVAETALAGFNRQARRTARGGLKLRRVVSVEAKASRAVANDRRCLVDMDVVPDDDDAAQPRRLSYLVHADSEGTVQCHLKPALQWRPHATVYFIVTVKNQGPWLIHLVQNLLAIVRATGDSALRLAVVDFDSVDMDVEGLLLGSGLPHLFLSGGPVFSRARGLQKMVEQVPQPGDIVVTGDLHLDLPSNFFEIVRKHVQDGRVGFHPLLIRLACGTDARQLTGFWETRGLGIFAMTKAEWMAMGGMNVAKFGSTYGGEDWDFFDRFIARGLICDELKVPGFLHHAHAHSGMWNASALVYDGLRLLFATINSGAP